MGVHWKDWCWSWNFGHLMGRTDSLKSPWWWERLKERGEGDDRGWDGWMASPIRWTWVWVNSRSWWWTGRPGMWQFMGSQRVGDDWVTELNWTEYICFHLSGRHYWTFLSKYLHLCSLQDLIFRPGIEWYNLPLEVSTLDILLKHENY